MAQGTGSTFGNFKILIGDGATPTEAFAPICGVTSKGVSYSTETVETDIPDCADEDLPSFKNVGVKSIGCSMQCSGVWTAESHETLLQWWKSSTPKNVKIQYASATTGDVEYLAAPAVLANLEHNAEKGDYLKGSFSLMFTEMPTFTDAA